MTFAGKLFATNGKILTTIKRAVIHGLQSIQIIIHAAKNEISSNIWKFEPVMIKADGG
jgi:hypothetical protein